MRTDPRVMPGPIVGVFLVSAPELEAVLHFLQRSAALLCCFTLALGCFLSACGTSDPTTPNQAPTVAIVAPVDEASFPFGQAIEFEGTASDPEDGTLAGSSMVWTSDVNGEIGTGNSFARSDLLAGDHTITLTSTDSDGASASAQRQITVAPNQAPAVAIVAPVDGASFPFGQAIAFAGTASDPEDGTLAGSSVLWTSDVNGNIGTGNSFARSDLWAGDHTITLTATDSHGASASAQRLIRVVASSDVIEALFIGSGPLTPTDGNRACSYPSFWTGFPRGTAVSVLVSTTVSAAQLAAIQAAVDQVASATGGATTATLQTTRDMNPLPGPGEVTATSHPDPVSQGCPLAIGCTIHTFLTPGVLSSSRAVLPPIQTPNAFAHDVVGHGILGMCHIDGNLIGDAAQSLMSGGPGVTSGDIARRLAPLDLDALQAVYGSTLDPGATRADFVAEGLVDP